MYILLFVLWVIFNGRLTVEIAVFGVAVAGFAYWFAVKFLEYNPRWDILLFKYFFAVVQYLFVLAVEVVKSSMAVLKIVYSHKIEIQPTIVFFDVPLKNEFMRTVLANSITLTPGTITVNVESSRFCVHALDSSFCEDIDNSVFVKLLKKVEDDCYGTTTD